MSSGWMTKDPIGFVAEVNFYKYALNNPINYYDMLGLIGGIFLQIIVVRMRLEKMS